MQFSCDDLKLCTDKFAYCTDNPLGGRRCTNAFEAKGECQETEDTDLGGGSPKLIRSYYDVTEHIAEIGACLPNSSVLDVSCLILNNALIYLLGTDHVNPKCQMDVSKVISLVKPNKVVVELCKLRACRCSLHMDSIFQNPARFTFGYMKKVILEIGFVPAFLFVADVFNEMAVSGNIHLEFGGEMTSAIRQAKLLNNCQLLLGDRPIAITIQRRASAMSWWTKARLIAQVSLGLACRPLRSLLLANAHRMAESDTMTPYIFIFERDLCLANALQMAASTSPEESVKIVAVVGGGHTKGIHQCWGKVNPEIVRVIYEPTFDFNLR